MIGGTSRAWAHLAGTISMLLTMLLWLCLLDAGRADRIADNLAGFRNEYAACASAPSHKFHAMPPRITRNSHRPRASDRTMITTQTSASLAHPFKLDWRSRRRQRKPTGPPTTRTNLSIERIDSGLDLETKVLLDLRSRKNFFLDIPFYRTQLTLVPNGSRR